MRFEYKVALPVSTLITKIQPDQPISSGVIGDRVFGDMHSGRKRDQWSTDFWSARFALHCIKIASKSEKENESDSEAPAF